MPLGIGNLRAADSYAYKSFDLIGFCIVSTMKLLQSIE